MKKTIYLVLLFMFSVLGINAHTTSLSGVPVQVIFPKNGPMLLIIDFDNGNKDLSYEIPAKDVVIEISIADVENKVVCNVLISKEYTLLPDLKKGEYVLSIKIGSKVYHELVLF